MKPLIDRELQMGERLKEIVDEFKKAGVKYGGMYLFFKKTFVAIDRELMISIYRKDFDHFQATGIFHDEKDILGVNLLSVEGNRYKNMKSSLTPIFSSSKIKIMFSIMLEKSKRLKEAINKLNNASCDAKYLMEKYATDVVISTAFGLDCNSLEDEHNEFFQKKQDFFNGSPIRLVLEALCPWSILGYMGHKAVGDQALENFFIRKTKESVEDKKNNNTKGNDFIELLMNIKKQHFDSHYKTKGRNWQTNPLAGLQTNLESNFNSQESEILTVEQMAAQAFLFYVGGFETTSTTLMFALLNLALYQNYQDKCRQEVEDVLINHDGSLCYEAVNEMVYLEQFVQESLRHYPIFNLHSRVCSKEYIIPGTNHIIEKGTHVLMSVTDVHMNPEYYPDPEKFNPDQFSKENKQRRPDGSFLSFGFGPRQCIGMKLGLINVKLALASILQSYQVVLDNKTELPIKLNPKSVCTTPKEHIWLKFIKL